MDPKARAEGGLKKEEPPTKRRDLEPSPKKPAAATRRWRTGSAFGTALDFLRRLEQAWAIYGEALPRAVALEFHHEFWQLGPLDRALVSRNLGGRLSLVTSPDVTLAGDTDEG